MDGITGYRGSKSYFFIIIPMRVCFLFLLLFMFSFSGCRNSTEKDVFQGFINPPAEARPFVRWWWNGNRITEKEIIRQLDVMKDAGIGGVEINPIAFPEWSDSVGVKSLRWLSPEWNRMIAAASVEAGKRGMITDLIVGSGWPFGGEFLTREESIQRVIINEIQCRGGDRINETVTSLLRKAIAANSRTAEGESLSAEILFIDLVPESVRDTSDITKLTGRIDVAGRLEFEVPSGEYKIIYGVVQKGHRDVMHGAPGAAGPVMDHYKREVTLAYLNRLKKISEDTGIPLNKLIRALFCDSIELAGANWTDGFEEIFYKTYNYRLTHWLPFIFYEASRGYLPGNSSAQFTDDLKRVRYDYNSLLVKVFLDNFTRVFQEFCTENGVKCRYQAYGTPFLMGMMEGNMITDIPESNNWLFSGNNMDSEEWSWNQDHGYMIWNMYAASGGHLMGRKIISCESMTNTRGVFKASLEDIKRHDDMNFITGINHTILHGYNYSPVEAGFPGWIRYGEYFSEQNSWWPYFRKWADYNARLSYLFQQSKPEKSIAILGPTGDVWAEKGLTRVPFHNTPAYCYRLWEGLSQVGSSCDYIDESIIINGIKEDGKLKYGQMTYKAVVLCDVRSVKVSTALELRKFADAGGKIVAIGEAPSRSLSFQNSAENDSIVNSVFKELMEKQRIRVIEPPKDLSNLRVFSENLLRTTALDPDVKIADPSADLFQIRKTYGDKEIYFFVNPNRNKSISTMVEFATGNLRPWVWNPEDGTRKLFPVSGKRNELNISLGPLESLLLVFDDKEGSFEQIEKSVPDTVVLNTIWKAEFMHKNGKVFYREFETLSEFGTSDDEELSSFAGIVKYITEFESDGNGSMLLLPEVNRGVSEVYINGKPAGLNWYGLPCFDISGLLKPGKNKIEIKYTTLLSNYVRTLKDNSTAVQWTKGYEKMPMGIGGRVKIF